MLTELRLRLRPDQSGLRVALFDLEADIMEVVWAHDWGRFAVADVHEALRREREIAYTTVMTTVSRLFDKGLLERERDGRRYLYRAALSRRELDALVTRRLLDALPTAGREAAVALLADQLSEADGETLSELEGLIRARRRELEAT